MGGGPLREGARGCAENLKGLVAAPERVVEVLGAGQGQLGHLVSPAGVSGGEDGLRILRPPEPGHGAGEGDLRREARPGVDRRPRQRLGGVETPRAEHPAGCRHRGLGMDRLSRLHTDQGQPARIVISAKRGRLEGVAQPAEQLPPPERGQSASQSLGVEGMGEPHLPPPPVPLRHGGGGDHRSRLQVPDDRGRHQPLQNVEGEWLGESERFGRLALRRGEGAKPLLDGLEGASCRHRLSVPAPYAVPLRQSAGTEPDLDQLVEEEGVALAQPAQLVARAGVQVTVEHLTEERLHLGPGERLQLDPADRPLLAQPHDRIGQGLTGSGRQQEGGRLGARQLVQESGRSGVEELSVVNRDDQPPAPTLVPQLANAVTEDVKRAHGEGFREERREGPEGDGRGRHGGGDLPDEPAVPSHASERFRAEAGLADPGSARDDDAARGRTLQLPSEQGQFLVPTDERPGRPAGGGRHVC